MRFSTTTEYALRVLAKMAGAADERFSVRQLHEDLELPHKYLRHVMSQLASAGLVEVTRGKYGGYMLSRPAEEISILAVVEACEGLQAYSRCLLGLNECSPKRPCALHVHLVPLTRELAALLENTCIDALAGGRVTLDIQG